MHIDVPTGTTGTVGISNEGFWGFNVNPAKRYAASFRMCGSYDSPIEASFRNKISNNKVSSTSANFQSGNDWITVNLPIFQPTSSSGNLNNTFEFAFDGTKLAGKPIHVNLLSLFKQTYYDRYNEVREDLVQAYRDLKSTWVRLPRGNNMQGPEYGLEWNYCFPMFYNAIKARYPNTNLISSTIPAPLGKPGAWLDLHMYDNQDFSARQYDVFDHTDRAYPVIVGEYACVRPGGAGGPEVGAQTMGMALAEGITLLGAERSSDVIRGPAYGALIKHYVEEPNTVAVMKHTADQILLRASYYVQKLFSEYHGETAAVSTQFGEGIGPVYWSATRTGATRYLELVNYYGPGSVVDVVFEGQSASTAKVVTLTAASCNNANKLPRLGGEATKVETSTLQSQNGRFTVTFGASCEVNILVV